MTKGISSCDHQTTKVQGQENPRKVIKSTRLKKKKKRKKSIRPVSVRSWTSKRQSVPQHTTSNELEDSVWFSV